MEKVVFILALTLASLSMLAQGNYEQGMQNAFQLWEEGKNHEASALFERIAAAEKDNWLPNYYLALVNTTTAFQIKDSKQVSALLSNAQRALDIEMDKDAFNVELMVLQAMIHTAWIAHDPMNNGQKLSGTVMQIYGQAEGIAPNNPRVILSKAEFEMGSAQFFGTEIAPICVQIEKALQLFDTFKPQTPFHPNWGKERAITLLNNCK
ncbi:MAG: hypothetical protein COZ75_04815 [Flavobacteriaceae bacterium CG_4_8_14_3_um_filter_34_10]|nr:hypothetical protein [Flavobacteriia bacterium]OIP50206.1 MAG: hypothetical protein AUK33_08665 [Flavobacteriaceae bacterium CG2_30_34_30]PIQ19043.1 MAG: hypothetical protein COW66_03485 [Flavobacteriaceae bacterium CG18_big_fil_WC_8_21_14_2_50_34_36]PIV49368.1 MAG: hypothetical protein COS19_08485 [Flavobacteriaceae bacterium CG02_land_8_20_14_3_00_34_13]PIX09823.1 MAG: hypothetical protein COZ75_04815 [Flavobacteriaceae bacterium CG_4_8_14_3_um_filter_34_10]PIZ09032.1 MAG: hypothetical pr